MLKLNNSFSRFLKITCENVYCNKIHVKFKCLKSKSALSSDANSQLDFRYQYSLLKFNLAIKRKSQLKRFVTNDLRLHKPMTESVNPINHVSHGGQFEVDDISENHDWKVNSDKGSTENLEWKQCDIPSNFRVWETVGGGKTAGNTFNFKVLSYNVLAQYLLESHPYLYKRCPSHDLKWNIRWSRIYKEIVSLAPDIICLQEVQATHINDYYCKFKELGYNFCYKIKTGVRYDGCAIFFRSSLFEPEGYVSVEYYQPDSAILNRHNIGIIVKLKCKCLPDTSIVVATTHLLFNPKRVDVRLAQMQLFLAEIDRFAYYNDGLKSRHLPIILTGDLNSMPNSEVIQLLDQGHVSTSPFGSKFDLKDIGVTDNCQHLTVYINRPKGQNIDFSMTKIYNSVQFSGERTIDLTNDSYNDLFNTGAIGHSLDLVSAYTRVKEDGSIEATTFQNYWITVDYIYFSNCSSLKLVERLRLPTAEECEVLKHLPNSTYGSDHLALAAVFELKPYQKSS